MLDTIFVGMSGLTGYSKGLRVIGNNLTNVNTPGFKGSQLQFTDLFYQQVTAGSNDGLSMQLGTGLDTVATALNFQKGAFAQTHNPLDVAIDGEGFFVLRDEEAIRYTQAGQFQFDASGVLVSRISGAHVQGMDAAGQPSDISLAGMQIDPPKATSTVVFTGNLSSTASADVTVNAITVFDAVGASHAIKCVFQNNNLTTPGDWTVIVSDASGNIATGHIRFANGKPVADAATIALTYAPAGADPLPLVLDFSGAVTSFAAGNTSTLAVASQDGRATGNLTGTSFDDQGTLVATYSNGNSAKGMQLALARFDSNQDLIEAGHGEFENPDPAAVHLGTAKVGVFGSIAGGTIENANVDLAEEFSNLIVMQRGYQASSHVISTVNDMIQQLFDMKGHR